MTTGSSDGELDRWATAAAAGDGAALDRLLAAVRPEVLQRCARFLPNRWDAEEACQDALLAVARRISSFEGRAHLRTWLFQVTAHSAIDTYRRLKRQGMTLAAGARPGPGTEAADPRTTSVVAGTRIDVLEALERTDARYAEPVALRDLCGLDYAEIAALLRIPLGTVRAEDRG